MFKRALIYLGKQKARNILLLFIIVFFALSFLIGISIIKSVNNTIAEFKSSLSVSFSVIKDSIPYADNSQFYTDSNGDGIPEYIGPMLCLGDAEAILNIDERIYKYNVEDVIRSLTVDIDLCPGFANYYAENVDEIYEEEGGSGLTYEEYLEIARDSEIDAHTTWFHPEVETDVDHLFSIGAFELIRGEHIHKGDKHVALISEDLADNNNLDIGDTFIPKQINMYSAMDSDDRYGSFGEPFPLKIVGIFRVNFYQEVSKYTEELALAENYIYTDFESYKDWLHDWRHFSRSYLNLNDEEFNVDRINFYVESPDEIDDIISEIENSNVLDWKYFHIEKNNEEYEAAVKPINNISNMVLLFVILVSVGSTMVMFLLININAKSRHKEVEVYRSLGISRKSIIIQRIVEAVIVSLVAFAAALIIVNLFAAPLEANISKTINSNTPETDDYSVSYAESGVPVVESSKQTEISLNIQTGFEESISTFLITEYVVIMATAVSMKKKNRFSTG